MSAKVSVIVPFYNVAPYLERCLGSLCSQSLGEVEIVCVDDGSEDGSLELAEAFARRDARVRVIRQSHAGAGPARNAGLDAATGEYVFFCDADDEAEPELLERLWARAEELSADVVLTGRIFRCRHLGMRQAVRVSKALAAYPGVFSGLDFPTTLLVAGRTPLWDKLFRRSFVIGERIRFQDLPHSNDLYFAMTALATAGRIAVEDGAHYIHCPTRSGSLQNTKAKAPLAMLAAWDAISDGLCQRGLRSRYEVALGHLLLRCGIREIARFGSPDVRDAFYREFRRRFVRAAAESDLVSSGVCSRSDRKILRTVLADSGADRFVRLCRRRRQTGRLSRMLRYFLGLTIREVW